MKKGGIISISKQVIKLYDEYTDFLTKLQNLQNERNILSKNIGLNLKVKMHLRICNLFQKLNLLFLFRKRVIYS